MRSNKNKEHKFSRNRPLGIFFLFFIALACKAPSSLAATSCATAEISHIHDLENQLSIQQASSKLREVVKAKSPVFVSEGYTDGTVWLRFQKNNPEKCFIKLAAPQLDIIRVYYADQKTPELEIGDVFSFSNRPIKLNYFYLPIPENRKELILSLQSTATMTVPVEVLGIGTFSKDISSQYLMYGLFYGLLLAFILYAINTWIIFRQNAFLTYAAFATGMLLFFLDKDGLLYQFVWPEATEWKQRSVRFFAALSMGMGVLYFTQLLQIRNAFLRKSVMIYLVSAVCLAVATIVLPPSLTYNPTILLSIGSPLLMVVLPISSKTKEENFASILLFAGLVSLSGLIIYSASVKGWLQPSTFTENSMKLASIMEFLLLAIGIHHQTKSLIKRNSLHQAVFQIAKMLAHDLKKPFDKVGKFLSNLKVIASDDRLAYIERSSAQLESDVLLAEGIVDDLLAFGQKSPENHGTTDLASLLEEVLTEDYEVSCPDFCSLAVDNTSLKRVFINLQRNALDATTGDHEATYWVTVTPRNKKYIINMGNTGSTIPKADIHKVFDLFYSKKKSTGIGLAFAQKVIQETGGQIYVESNGYDSLGNRVLLKHPKDYVEFTLVLPQGGYHA